MQAIAFDIVAWTVCAAAMAVSVRYFLSSKPGGDEPADRAHLIFGLIHPQVLGRTLVAIATIWICLLLSRALAAQGDRILAGLVLAVAAPAMLAAALTLLALLLALLPSDPKPPAPMSGQKMHKARIATWVLLVAAMAAAALLPILR